MPSFSLSPLHLMPNQNDEVINYGYEKNMERKEKAQLQGLIFCSALQNLFKQKIMFNSSCELFSILVNFEKNLLD